MSETDESLGSERGEAVLAIFQRGAEFTKQILEENTRLRRELSEVQLRHGQAAQSDSEWDKLRQELIAKIEELENQNESILEQLRSDAYQPGKWNRLRVRVEEKKIMDGVPQRLLRA